MEEGSCSVKSIKGRVWEICLEADNQWGKGRNILDVLPPVIQPGDKMKGYFTCLTPNNKEAPCNIYTKRWGWLIRLYKKIRKLNDK